MTLLVSRQPAEDPPRPLRVLIVDDHLLYAEALSLLRREQDLDVVGIAGDGRQGLAVATELQPTSC